MKRFIIYLLGIGLLSGAFVLAFFSGIFQKPESVGASVHAGEGEAKPSAAIPVRVVRPKKGLERLSTQPGTVQAYESVRLYSKVPGFMKKQSVDIGDRVKAGQPLVILDVPELETQVKRAKAMLAQSKSRVVQMKARVKSVAAELEAAKAAVTQAEATAKSSAAWVRFRQKQHQRMKDLFTLRSIEEKLVDESKERYEAAVETERSSQAAILTSHAHVIAFTSKVDSAKADVDFAESEVEVAEADLEKQVVQLGFATVTAPFDGVVTQRSSFPGDFVRSANEGGSHEPILTVQRTDRMRVVVQIPDRDVPYAGPGDPAVVSIDSLGGKKMNATISRIARFEDPLTRLMQIEIDLPNPVGEICHGMYGKVTIILDRSADQFSIPSSCLVGKSDSGTGAVYVAKDNRAHLVQVQLGIDNAVEVGILKGIDSTTDIVLNPGNGISEGALLTVSHDAPRIVGSNEKR